MEWTQFIIMLLGMIGLFAWNRAEARSDARHMDAQLKANRDLIAQIHKEIYQEMKDFHGKLERQDAEFRGIMAKQDAEFRGRMEKQDAEFKAHLMYAHSRK